MDLLLHDENLNRRYEVELMLGPTDPSHIIRCIEYWDVERRRYPAYDHVAVLVAEDITSRFLNVMALLAGSIPLIAVQMSALKVDDKVVLHFTRVLDQATLRSDDEYELGERSERVVEMDRSWWEQRLESRLLGLCDQVLQVVDQATGQPHRMFYRKRRIDIVPAGNGAKRGQIWCFPKKALVGVAGYVKQPEGWIQRFEDAGLSPTLRRGKKAVLVPVTPEELQKQRALFHEFVRDAASSEEGD